MGFYIQDDFFESCSELDRDTRHEILGCLIDLFFTDEDIPPEDVFSRALYTSMKSRVLIAKKRSKAGSTGKDESNEDSDCEQNENKTESNANQNSNQNGNKTESNANQNENKTESNLLKSESESKSKNKDLKTIMSGKPDHPYAEITDYLNAKAGTSYRPSSDKTRRAINARFADGFTLEDFKAVIDAKVLEWRGTEFEKYLRPETLFGTKFEGYLQQAPRSKPLEPIPKKPDPHCPKCGVKLFRNTQSGKWDCAVCFGSYGKEVEDVHPDGE